MDQRSFSKQSALVRLSDDYADVMAAQDRFSNKINEVCAFLKEIEGSQPTPTSAQATTGRACDEVILTRTQPSLCGIHYEAARPFGAFDQ
jgi:hypothetical protein